MMPCSFFRLEYTYYYEMAQAQCILMLYHFGLVSIFFSSSFCKASLKGKCVDERASKWDGECSRPILSEKFACNMKVIFYFYSRTKSLNGMAGTSNGDAAHFGTICQLNCCLQFLLLPPSSSMPMPPPPPSPSLSPPPLPSLQLRCRRCCHLSGLCRYKSNSTRPVLLFFCVNLLHFLIFKLPLSESIHIKTRQSTIAHTMPKTKRQRAIEKEISKA